MSAHAKDPQYEETTIAKVEGDSTHGWDISRTDGWSFFVPAGPVVPHVGSVVRFYGRGVGYPVRGLVIDGQTVFYRTEAEDDDYRANESYGATVDDLIAKWDRGQSIWSVELGGLGPGYEQCIQIMAVEFARAGKDMPRTDDAKADWQSFRDRCDVALKPIDAELGGVSGAQFGQAAWLAWQWCFGGGPRALIERAKKQERETILVSRHFPQAPVKQEAA